MPNRGTMPSDKGKSMTSSHESIHGSLDGDAYFVTVETEDISDSEPELTPKTVRRFLETISESDEDEDSDDDVFFLQDRRPRASIVESMASSSTIKTTSTSHSDRSQSICADKLTPQEARFLEQMRALKKFVRDRNNLIAGKHNDADKNQDVPPDGGWGWVVVLASALVFFFAGGLSRCFTLIYQQFLEVFQQSAAATSATASIFGAVKMCTSPLVSILCTKFTKRTVAVSGGIITCVAMVMTSYPVSLEYLYISYGIVAAFGINMVLTPCFIILSEYFKKRRARAMSLAMLGGSLGGMTLPPLLTYLFDTYGYSGAMLIYSGLMLNICLAGTLFRPVKLRSRAEVEKEKEKKIMKKEAKRKKTLKCVCEENRNGHQTTNHVNSFPKLSDIDETASNTSLDKHRSSVCPVCDVDDDTSHHSIDFGSIDSLNNFKDEDTDDNISSVSEDHESEQAQSTRFTSEQHPLVEKDGEHVRKRRVSFQVSTVTKLIPAVSFDDDDQTDSAEAEEKEESACLRKWKALVRPFGFHLFKKPRFLFYSMLMMASISSLSISGTFLSGLISDMDMDKSYTSIMLSASAITDIPSKFASGFIFDLKKVRPYRSVPLAGLGFVTGALGLGIGFSQNYLQLFITFMIYNFLASAYHTQHATVLADLVGAENLSAAMGLCRLCQGIGFCLGPTIGGHLKDVTGRYQNAYVFCGSLLVVATLVYTTVDQWFLWRKRKIERAAYFPKGHYARYRHDSIAVT